MSTETKILTLLQQSPQSSDQLAAALGLRSSRYVRKILADLCARGKVSFRSDASDRRTRIYSITTGPTDPGSVPQNVFRYPESVPLSVPLSEIEEHIEEHIAEHLGEHIAEHPDKIPAQSPQNQNLTPMRHSKPSNGASCEEIPQSVPLNSIQDTGSIPLSQECDHACSSCPLQVCELEHDALQFGVQDRAWARVLPEIARCRGWERRQNPHTKVWTIYPNTPRPLTLQVGRDSVTIYSSEPDHDWVIEWVGLVFAAIHPNPAFLLHKLQHPEIYRDEQTIVISDINVIMAIRNIIAPYIDPRNRVYYLPAPNGLTPGLKIYERDGTMRVEFDARDEQRARAALVMRQEFLLLACDIAKTPGLYLEWETKHYGPRSAPVTITVDNDAVAEAITTLGKLMDQKIEVVQEQLRAVLTEYITTKTEEESEDLKDLIALVESMPDFELERVVQALTAFTGSQDAAYVYLAAFALWTESFYRGSVLKEDIAERLRKAKTPIPLSRIADAIDLLTRKHLLTTHPDRDINFSKPGIRLGKKLVFREKNPEDT